MREFNDKLVAEGNRPVGDRLHIAAEVQRGKIPLKLVGESGSFTLPLGVEYLSATSRTQHSGAVEANVNWQLATVGFYVSPTFSLALRRRDGAAASSEVDKKAPAAPPPVKPPDSASVTQKAQEGVKPATSSVPRIQILFRPIGLGYYFLGKFTTASLTVSGRDGQPGNAAADGRAVGVLSAGGLNVRMSDLASLLVEGGFRKLTFTNVTLTAKNGFRLDLLHPEVVSIQIPEALDYSGWFVRFGVGLTF